MRSLAKKNSSRETSEKDFEPLETSVSPESVSRTGDGDVAAETAAVTEDVRSAVYMSSVS